MMLDLVVDAGSALATAAVLTLLVLRAGGVLGQRPVRRPSPQSTTLTPESVEAPVCVSVPASAGSLPVDGEAPPRAPVFA